MATDDKNAKDLVKAVEKIAAGKAAKENQALASELDKTFSNLASVQEKLRQDNAKTAKTIKDGAAAELKANQEQQKSLQEIATSTIAGGTSTKDRLNAQKALEELNLNMQITADKAKATQEWQKTSAGQALAMKKQMEDQGQVAEDSKEFQKLSFKARQEDYEQRLDAATSPAAKKQIKEDMRADAKKNGDRLDKIGAGIAGMWANSKKVLITGAKAFLSTLAIGAFMVALGNFLQSDEFKEITKYIMDVVVPKLKEFYNAFFGDGGGFIKGISALFGDKTGIGAVVAGIAGVTLLFGASKLLKLFSPLTKGIGLLFKGIGGIASKIPVVGKLMGGGDKAAKLAGQSPGAKAGSAGKKFGEVIGNIGKGLGKGIEGILRGLAMGLSAFSNPKILLGAAILAGSIVVIGAGIAAAVAIIATSLPLFARNMKKFEDLDGKKLLEVAEGIGAIGIAMMKMGGGGIAGGIGSFVKGVGGALGKLFGGEEQKSPLDQLKIFSETKIDAVQAKSNAEALGAYGIAMAKAGAGEGLGGVGAILGSVGAFFAGKEAKTPLQKLVEFGDTYVNSEQVTKNAESLGIYSKAMGVALKAGPTGGFGKLLDGLLGSIGAFFGVKKEAGPLEKLKLFGETEINSEQVAKMRNH